MFNSKALSSLRSILLIDATTCALMSVLLTAGSGVAGQIMQLPAALLFYAGLSLFPIAVFMTVVALRDPVQPTAAWLIISGNVLWVAASFGLLVSGWIAPNYLGAGFITLQALVVAVLARLEYTALHHVHWRPV